MPPQRRLLGDRRLEGLFVVVPPDPYHRPDLLPVELLRPVDAYLGVISPDDLGQGVLGGAEELGRVRFTEMPDRGFVAEFAMSGG